MSEVQKSKKKTYLELRAEHQALEKLMVEAKAEELQDVITDMKEKIAAWNITADQLGFVLAPIEPPKKPKKAKSDKPATKIEKDEFGNSIKYLPDGSKKPFFYFNPANQNEKAYEDGRRKNWLKKLIDSKVNPSTYTIK